MKGPLTWGISGADDGIRTRDPHLGKETHLLRQDRCTPSSRLSSVCSSAQSAESAPLHRFTFNALNLCGFDHALRSQAQLVDQQS